MSHRAAIILIENGQIALIERHRQGQHYFTFPGGHVEPGETPEQAAVRETEEELGLKVGIRRLLATIWWHTKPQYYYLVERLGGEFGTGSGEEMKAPLPEKGSYQPIWKPIGELLDLPVLPRSMAEITVKAQSAGWPDPAPVLHDDE
ncbi:MAG TPA: NUDIX domain-containing protein [Anaerolineales bacterium]|nr:NUDIX domain-containing protein [Anaerolineales bacterium]